MGEQHPQQWWARVRVGMSLGLVQLSYPWQEWRGWWVCGVKGMEDSEAVRRDGGAATLLLLGKKEVISMARVFGRERGLRTRGSG